MAALRFLSFLLFVLAAVALATDVTRARTTPGQGVLIPLEKHWRDLSPTTHEDARRAVIRSTHPLVWSVALAPVLLPPAWLVFSAGALILGYLGRHRRRIRIFTN
jgi:hypothetical protein